jgi:hypothetical protein
MAASEQMDQAAAADGVGHNGRNIFNVRALCVPDAIQYFCDAITILDNAQTMPPK